MAFTTIANVKEYAGITITDFDALITNLIPRMEAFIKKFTDRDIEATNFTEQYDGTFENGGVLLLREFPINSVASLFDDIALDFTASSEIPSTDFVVESKPGILRLTPFGTTLPLLERPRQFNEGVQNIKITYNAGFTTVPLDLEQATIELVAFKLRAADSGAGAITSEKLADHAVTFAGVRMSEPTREVLESYKNRQLVLF